MRSGPYQRELRRALRAEYGVTDARVVKGHGRTSHPRLLFTHAGREWDFLIAGSPSDERSATVKMQEMRRALGPPPPPELAAPRRKLESMMPPLDNADHPDRTQSLPVAPPTYPGHVAVYADRVRFSVPAEIATLFGAPTGIQLRQTDAESWEVLRANVKRPALKEDLRIESTDPAVRRELAPFGLSPAEFLVQDGVMLIHCPAATRRPLASNAGPQQRRRKRSDPPGLNRVLDASGGGASGFPATPAPGAYLDPVPSAPSPAALKRVQVAVPTPDEIKRVLEDVRRVEALTPYRLKMTKDEAGLHWAWIAPRIE